MNSITVKLDTASRLRAAGWKRKTVFIATIEGGWDIELLDDLPYEPKDFLYMPTLSELLEELPPRTEVIKFLADYSVICTECAIHTLPVEAAAELWIKLNSKEETK